MKLRSLPDPHNAVFRWRNHNFELQLASAGDYWWRCRPIEDPPDMPLPIEYYAYHLWYRTPQRDAMWRDLFLRPCA